MSIPSEVPDAHIACQAGQFLATAELLLAHVPRVVAPSALLCNAAVAIELYLKSLDSRWEMYDLLDEMGVEGSAITSLPKVFDHRLDNLFASLPPNIKDYLNDSFAQVSLAASGLTLDTLLSRYAETFVRERYAFENRGNTQSHPISEIVNIARFFRDAVSKLPTVRY